MRRIDHERHRRVTSRGLALGIVILVAMPMLLTVPSAARAAVPQSAPLQTDVAASRYFFHPRLVLGNAERIGLTAEQRGEVQHAFQASQGEYQRRRYELGNAMTVIAALAVSHPVDEEQILEQLDAVLEIERQIKRQQLLLLVRIKNVLTPEQHVLLDEIKHQAQARDRRQ